MTHGYLKALIWVTLLALSGVWALSAQAETPMAAGLAPEPETVTITREEVPPPEPPPFKGDVGVINMNGEYGTCVSTAISTIPADVSALERQVLMQQAQQSCNDGIEAWHAVESEKARARMAEAQRTPWWHKLLPSADTLIGVGANVWMHKTTQKYQFRRDREMWDAVQELGSGPPGTVEVNGGEGSIDLGLDSPGSFNDGDFTYSGGDKSFNTDTRTRTTTDSDNTTTTFD